MYVQNGEGGVVGKGWTTEKIPFLKKFSRKKNTTKLEGGGRRVRALVVGPLEKNIFCGFPMTKMMVFSL